MAARRPFVDFQEVRQKVTIPDLLRALNLHDRFRWNASGTKGRGICPIPSHIHGISPNPDQFTIDFKDGTWLFHCHSTQCLKGGGVIELAKELTGLDDSQVRFLLAEKFADRLNLTKPAKAKPKPREQAQARAAPDNTPEPVKKSAAPGDSVSPDKLESPKAASQAQATLSASPDDDKRPVPLRFFLRLDGSVDYLRQRGVHAATIERFGLGLCTSLKSIMAGYVCFPVYRWPQESRDELPVAYLGRLPSDDPAELAAKPRYKWPAGTCKSKLVYGLREALDSTDGQPLILVEGPFDLFALVQAGYRSTVCCFGSSLSLAQTRTLAATGRAVCVLFDGDPSGRSGAAAAVELLSQVTFVRRVILDDEQEPERLNADQLRHYLPFLTPSVPADR